MEPPVPPQPGDTSGSQSSGAGAASSSSGTGGTQTKKREVPYAITPTKIEDVDDLSIGYFTLAKPSNVPSTNLNQDVCMYSLAAADNFSLRILREVNHPNILHLQGVMDSSPPTIVILVDSYSHSLRTEVVGYARKLDDSKLESIRAVVRQLIEAVDELRTNGFYDGSMNLDNTYYDRGSALLKLGNFREKEGNDLLRSQYEDLVAAGTMIQEIADILKNGNPGLDLILMEDLSHFLKNLEYVDENRLPIQQVKGRALDQVYFWDKPWRTSFYVHGVVRALKIEAFEQRIEALEFISTEWNLDDHDGVLTAMNNHRLKENKLQYTGSRVSYVHFVSGAYTHESALKSDEKIKESVVVDDLIPRCLCLELVRIAREFGLHIC